MKKLLIAFLCASGLFTAAQQSASHVSAKNNDPSAFARTITSDELKQQLQIIAGKDMEGRETATPGQKKAAAYIEGQFRGLGLAPGNNGNYQLPYPVYQDSLLSTSIEVNGKNFELDKDFSLNVAQNNNCTYRFAEVAFVGNGMSDSARDDYKSLDVRGKVVLLLAGPQPQGRRSFGNQFALADAAQRNGALAVLVIGSNFPRQQKTNARGNMYLHAFQKTVRPNQFQVSENIAREIMGDDYAKAKAGALQQKTYSTNLTLSFNKSTSTLESSDVLGVLEGTDLKDEYVLVTAHYDHLGIRPEMPGDNIYNGANDNATGCGILLELANVFSLATQKPRRSILFASVTAEEQGLLGHDTAECYEE